MILPLASGVFPSLAPSDRSAFWAVTGRLGGVSAGAFSSANLADHVGDQSVHVDSNRAALAALVGVERSNLVVMTPVHGGDVAVFPDCWSSAVVKLTCAVSSFLPSERVLVTNCLRLGCLLPE